MQRILANTTLIKIKMEKKNLLMTEILIQDAHFGDDFTIQSKVSFSLFLISGDL